MWQGHKLLAELYSDVYYEIVSLYNMGSRFKHSIGQNRQVVLTIAGFDRELWEYIEYSEFV